MKTRPEGVDDAALVEVLKDAWRLDVEEIEYAPVGFGSYHWEVIAGDGRRRFVTVDDLGQKPWLGSTRDDVFRELRRAFETAATLRDGGLDFVVAPVHTRSGEVLQRLGARYSVAVFPFHALEAREFGGYRRADERRAAVDMLVELHRMTPLVRHVARPDTLALHGREYLDAALREHDAPWSGGPFSESARHAFAQRVRELSAMLAAYDRLRLSVAELPPVVTHGEPHAGNVLRDGDRLVVVDWDTAALAPCERDLWMVLDGNDGRTAAHYEATTGHAIDRRALDFFRLRWDLSDIAAFVALLRAPHRENADTRTAFEGLTGYLDSVGDCRGTV